MANTGDLSPIEKVCNCALKASSWYLFGFMTIIFIAISIVLHNSYFRDFAILMGKLAGLAYLPWILTGAWILYSTDLCRNIDTLKAEADENLASYADEVANRYIPLLLIVNLAVLIVLAIWALARKIADICCAKERIPQVDKFEDFLLLTK